ATILKAKREGRPVAKDEFSTACTEACGSGALVFGDINNPEDTVTKLKEDDSMYHLLEHVDTQHNVCFQVKVRNTSNQISINKKQYKGLCRLITKHPLENL